ncbi:hypothetical protein PPROV_000982500 [Pycnococcus provasolii]|uniref:Solute-binding protein family 5 domain-containing protein n=1 Tax=Pycnococcus provasolii TaxID=41880 RepID=A0A830HWN6_9CHLO|nr:hypothetical protein PPROV_000982500 [Pycnococcus provasolii]
MPTPRLASLLLLLAGSLLPADADTLEEESAITGSGGGLGIPAFSPDDCRPLSVDFIVKEGDPHASAVVDEITRDLAAIGISVNTSEVDREMWGELMSQGAFNMFMSKTWGAPYDPHSYATSWRQATANAHHVALENLTAPLTRESLMSKIEAVQKELDQSKIAKGWEEILRDVHGEAFNVPLWGERAPYVFNRRLIGVLPGNQLWAYDLNDVRILSGSANVTVAPGSTNGLFQSVGPLNPHLYFPNELFVNNWIYEGLVRYGKDGAIEPALATEWEVTNNGDGQRAVFTLREGVKFHDGSSWNCSVAKLNFDHVLNPTVKERHLWYGLPEIISSWSCDAEGRFVIETSAPYYPLLQELGYLRPLVMTAASAFAEGGTKTDTHNSCTPQSEGGFGPEKWDHLHENVTCVGLKAPIGTGPFKFVSKEVDPADNTTDLSVLFARNEAYWGGAPAIEFLEVKYFNDTDAVEAALLSGDLDMALGIGPLTSSQVRNFETKHSGTFETIRSDVFQNTVIVLNTGMAPTDDINVRKAIIHAINKAPMVEEEFFGLNQVVSQLFPKSAPFSDINLFPQWDYDLEKAALLNCPGYLERRLAAIPWN